MSKKVIIEDEPIHEYFGLSYARYLVIPRSLLQSMPAKWQHKLVKLLEEAWESVPEDLYVQDHLMYLVTLRDTHTGKMVSIDRDPLNEYERGRRQIPLKKGAKRNGK